jgi:hypothetical protein
LIYLGLFKIFKISITHTIYHLNNVFYHVLWIWRLKNTIEAKYQLTFFMTLNNCDFPLAWCWFWNYFVFQFFDFHQFIKVYQMSAVVKFEKLLHLTRSFKFQWSLLCFLWMHLVFETSPDFIQCYLSWIKFYCLLINNIEFELMHLFLLYSDSWQNDKRPDHQLNSGIIW